jgi:hypothetical protein
MDEFSRDDLEVIAASLALSADVTKPLCSARMIQKLMNIRDKAMRMAASLPKVPEA